MVIVFQLENNNLAPTETPGNDTPS
jgi:hypothetical protein